MRLAAAVVGDLQKAMAEEIDDVRTAATSAAKLGADGAKEDLRAQVRGAGLGERMAKTWQSKVYPQGRRSAGAAGFIFSKAPEIISAFNDGTVIRSGSGTWLAIPTPATPRGRGGRKMTPLEVERRYGQPLRFVYRKGRTGLLVFDNVRIGKAGTARTLRRTRGGAEYTPLQGRTTAVMFILVPQVRIPKRLDIERVAQTWADRMPGLFLAGFPVRGNR
ncbi:MAG: DUF6441 family protein [Inquilinus sp.]|uniref:DUF6441 family protein n=1 Tax=Inquilinus sp. TaxID=1932117 RepID=UPI003F354794